MLHQLCKLWILNAVSDQWTIDFGLLLFTCNQLKKHKITLSAIDFEVWIDWLDVMDDALADLKFHEYLERNVNRFNLMEYCWALVWLSRAMIHSESVHLLRYCPSYIIKFILQINYRTWVSQCVALIDLLKFVWSVSISCRNFRKWKWVRFYFHSKKKC